MKNKLMLAYITCKNKREAEKIGKELVRKKIIGCANIIPKITSYYLWQKKLIKENETILFCKLLKNKQKILEKKVKEMHSYKIPFIGFIEINKVNKAYIEWLKRNTTTKKIK